MANMYRQVDDKRIQLTDEEQKEYDNSQGFSEEEGLRLLRMQRNVLLTETDWLSFGDSPEMSDAWKKYRQDLRDITKTYKSPDDVKWPTKPE
tara:strand:- start:248 stop:523 length:276 start_codon:yes stop_codon:yes gene_type:complete